MLATPDRSTISIHALREEGDPEVQDAITKWEISIHALREEGDITATSATDCGLNFYPRPPRGGRRDPEFKNIQRSLFLSTPSARRATRCSRSSPTGRKNFYPRPPRGGRRDRLPLCQCIA